MRIAAPMIGRVITSFLLELLVCSTIYEVWKGGGSGIAQAAVTARILADCLHSVAGAHGLIQQVEIHEGQRERN